MKGLKPSEAQEIARAAQTLGISEEDAQRRVISAGLSCMRDAVAQRLGAGMAMYGRAPLPTITRPASKPAAPPARPAQRPASPTPRPAATSKGPAKPASKPAAPTSSSARRPAASPPAPARDRGVESHSIMDRFAAQMAAERGIPLDMARERPIRSGADLMAQVQRELAAQQGRRHGG